MDGSLKGFEWIEKLLDLRDSLSLLGSAIGDGVQEESGPSA